MINGRATISDPDTGRPIYIGEGFIPQVEAAANKYFYTNKPNLPIFNTIMNDMADKAQSDTGNKLITQLRQLERATKINYSNCWEILIFRTISSKGFRQGRMFND